MNRLVELRLNRGLSVLAMAREMDIPPHVIRHAERGGRPRPENALRIADFFDLRVTDLWPVDRESAA